jgi:hypothetical protein
MDLPLPIQRADCKRTLPGEPPPRATIPVAAHISALEEERTEETEETEEIGRGDRRFPLASPKG